MCNHIGSYILNDVLKEIAHAGIIKEIGKKRTQEKGQGNCRFYDGNKPLFS